MGHGLLYTYSKFKEAVEADTNASNKATITALCKLFGSHIVLSNAGAIAEGGFIAPNHITSLIRLK